MDKLIITAAVVGSFPSKRQNPAVPYTPREIARSAVESCSAGASVVHLHVREPETGELAHRVDLFAEVIRIVRSECDVIVNVTTGVGPNWSAEDRLSVVPALAADLSIRPELASLNCGSVNFGMLDRPSREFLLNDVQLNPWSTMLHFADTMKRCGVKPELELYDSAMAHNASVLASLGAIEAPLHFQFVFGVLGGLQPTVENLVFLKNSIPPDATWSVCSVGLSIYNIGPVAIAAGGHVRVGLEDCLHVSQGVLAESSAQMVAKIRAIASEMGREVATPREARKLLHL